MMGNPKMRKSILAGLALWMVSAVPGLAEVHPWCATSGVVSPSPVCDFDSRNQCQNFLAGIGGSCNPNPAYVAAPTPQPMPTNAPPAVATKRR
jgi:hypothetical protein